MIRVSVVGAKGRMGSHVVEAVRAADDTELALALDAGDDLTQITPQNTDVVVEFTVPAVSLNNVLTLVRAGRQRRRRHHRLDRREARPGARRTR
jgi:4-hydroxy-tetrahydrodipicolinate reductase